MPTFGGPGVRGKVIKVRPYDDEGDFTLLQLSDRHRGLLLAMTEFLDWKTRWETLPSPLDDDETRHQYVDDLKDRLMMIIDFCAEMINCITTDEDTINAFNSYLINQLMTNIAVQDATNYAAHVRPNSENLNSGAHDNLINGYGGCDESVLAGKIIYLVDFMHDNNLDFIERLTAASTPQSRSKVMSDMIPEFSGDVIGGILSVGITALSGALAANYSAYYTESYEDDLICELKCLAEPNCSLSLNTLYGVFADRVGYTVDIGDAFSNAISFVLFGEFTSDKYVDLMHFLQIGAFLFMGGFVGYRSLNPLVNALSEGSDEPSDDYNDCDCPSPIAKIVGIIDDCGTSPFDFVEFEIGVPFDLDSQQFSIHTEHWYLAVQLPPGIWEVTLNSFTGTIVPPDDQNEAAYAWFNEESTFNNIQWNAPGSPDEFGTKVVADNVYSIWCVTQRWHFVLFNNGAFTANITVNPTV